ARSRRVSARVAFASYSGDSALTYLEHYSARDATYRGNRFAVEKYLINRRKRISRYRITMPTRKCDFFNSRSFSWPVGELDFSLRAAPIRACKSQPDLSPSHHRCPQE